jgi:DNA-binding IscR family transcriptional regulator
MDAMNVEMSEGEALLAGLLEQLWRMAQETPSRPCSLARVSKRTQRPMSALMRQLSFLSEAGMVEIAAREEGGGSVRLTAAGRELCAGWFGA